jgi:hypothetical protein
MAGPGVLNATTVTAERQRQPARAQPPFSRQHMIEASLTLEGRIFRTFVREGTSVNDLIEKVAREHGGSVEKVYYPSLNASEIVSVRIGDVCLMKSGTEGLHFYLGSSGIPFAALPSGIMFPNGDELRVGENTRNIGVDKTGDNFDPKRKEDFDQRYAGGTRTTDAAQKDIEKSHGGARSEKLLLPKNILVIDKETGEISTVSEYASKAEGFASPQFQTPTYTSVGLTMACDRGVLAVPMDGSATRVPYLFVKTFDGKITDHLSIQFNPFKASDLPYLKLKERAEKRSDAAAACFSSLCRDASAFGERPLVSPTSSAALGVMKPDKRDEPVQPTQFVQPFRSIKITPQIISHYWRHPGLLQNEDIRHAPQSAEPHLAAPSAPGKVRKKKPRRLAEKTERTQEKEKAKPQPKTEAAPGRRKRRPHPPLPAMPLARNKEGKKPKRIRSPRIRASDALAKQKKEKHARQLSFPKAIRKKSESKRQLRGRPKAAAQQRAELLNKAKPRVPAGAKRKMAKKGLPAYFRMELLGLLQKRRRKRRFSRGRAAAGN